MRDHDDNDNMLASNLVNELRTSPNLICNRITIK